jgi:4-amino-4-deoxy-L-arabinose transferase-like glycosyltransferase
MALLAGLLCALSPVVLLFGNLVLSHHPTMLALAGFVLCYLRALRSESVGWPVAGGIALAFAMLCRPLTAFGLALPFGMHVGWMWFRGRLPRAGRRLAAALAPLLVGITLLAAYNAALTGSPARSPYGLYTSIYSPNHVYGFYNVTRGHKHVGPKVIDNYNRWAEELTVPRAWWLAGRRFSASAGWSVGLLTVAWAVGSAVILLPVLAPPWRLILGAVLGIHAAYFAFAFEGIFEVSYVFESIPFLCVLAAGMCVQLGRYWCRVREWEWCMWLAALVAVGLASSWVRLLHPRPEGGIQQVRFARSYYADFQRQLAAAGVRPPAIVFIEPDPADRHLDLVTNSPTLDAPILRARNLSPNNSRLIQMYPDRTPWLYDARDRTVSRL